MRREYNNPQETEDPQNGEVVFWVKGIESAIDVINDVAPTIQRSYDAAAGTIDSVKGLYCANNTRYGAAQYQSVVYFAERVNNTIDFHCRRARHYYSYFKENNVTIREFIPALRLSDNKPGLYDTINNQFYTNSGSGEFLYN